MNKILPVALAFLIPAAAAFADAMFWTPPAADVQRVDAEVGKLASFQGGTCQPRHLSEFSRHYWGFTDQNGRHFIDGQLRLLGGGSEKPGVHIESRSVAVTDGGCGVANVFYDSDAGRMIAVTWGGFA